MHGSIRRVAHRGGAALAPENTLAAFQHALNFHIDAIELDVQMSRDGHLVVFHDDTLERLTNGQGEIADHDLAYLRSLNAAAHFPGGWSEVQRIPTLSEVLLFARGSGIQVLIEIKPQHLDGSYIGHPESVTEVVRELQLCEMQDRVLVMSFDWSVLPKLKVLLPAVQSGALVTRHEWKLQTAEERLSFIARVQALGVSWLDMDARLFTPEILDLVHSAGLHLGLWTVNDQTSLQLLAEAGVDSLTSDHPELFPA